MSTGADELVAAYLRELEREAERLPWNARMELLEDVRSHIEVALAETWPDETAGESGDHAAEAGGRGDAIGESGEGAAEAEAKSARVREILAALGEPREIVDSAVADEPGATVPPQAPPPGLPTGLPPGLPTGPVPAYAFAPTGPPYRLGTAEVFAVALLLGGTFLFGVGWILGLILLWTSPRWTVREKLVGTFALPGGLGLVVLLIGIPTSSKSCYGDPSGVQHCTTSGWSLPGWAGLVVAAICVALPIYTSFFLVRRARQHGLTQARTDHAISGPLLGLLVAVIAIFAVGAFAFVSVGGSAGSGAVTPSHTEPSAVATYPGGPVPSSSESESARPPSSNFTSH